MGEKKVSYFDFIRYHEDARTKVLRKEGATEELIASVDEEIAKEELKKKSRAK